MKKQQKDNEEIGRIIEREQIISYKKKPSNKNPRDSDQEIESAQSLKSGVFSEESHSSRAVQDVRFTKKNTPLPELNREKRRLVSKNLGTVDSKQVNNYLEKQVRQHDNLVLKQKNNHLTTENMKLKTKIMTLEKENQRLQKVMEEEGQKPRQPGLMLKDNRFKGSEYLSLKMTIKNMRKELDDQKKQNQKIKWSIKFTRINELECERDEILNETTRLRAMLEEEQSKRVQLKVKQHGVSHLEQKIHTLGEKNLSLMRENNQLQNKVKKVEENSKRFKQTSENEKSLNKMLFNAKRVIKEKQKQIENLKHISATEPKIDSEASIVDIKSSKQMDKGVLKGKEKRMISKSAQKYRKQVPVGESKGNCEQCLKYKQKIAQLQRKIEQLVAELKAQRQNNTNSNGMGDFRRQQIDVATPQEIETLCRFLTFRFKAHHLSFDEAEKYLVNGQISDETMDEEMLLSQMAESLVAEPFSVISSKYLEAFLMKIFYKKQCKAGQKVQLNETKKIKKSEVLNNFRDIVKPYLVMPQEKEEEMFIQIAELVTNYHQHILTALNRKRNGEGTITEADLIQFFNQIELEKEFTDFIICQIILESLDLEHLNYYTMFQIFYMPTQGLGGPETEGTVAGPNQPNKKKFQVDQNQIVKEEDEEYEESRSYVEGRQKTQSRRDQDLSDEAQNSHHQSEKIGKKEKQNSEAVVEQQEEQEMANQQNMKNNGSKVEEDDYEQLFQEQKMDQLPEEQKANEDEPVDDEIKPYMMEEVEDEYADDTEM